MIATGGYCPAIKANCSHWNKNQSKCALSRNMSQNGKEHYCKNAGSGTKRISDMDAYWRIT